MKYWLIQFVNFPFDITVGKVHFYAYFSGISLGFKNHTNDRFLGKNKKFRIGIQFLGYTFDFNIND